MKLFSSIAKAWNLFVKNKRMMPLAVFADLLFIVALTKLHYEIFNRASMIAIKLTAMISAQVGDVASATAPPSLEILQSAEFMSLYQQLLKHIGTFALGTLLVWLVAKGIAWFIAHKSMTKKVDIKQYVLKFTGMTAFWFVAFVALTIIALNVLDYALFGVMPLIGKTGANAFAVLMYWLLAYFAFISYSIIPKDAFKKTFVLGWKNAKELFPVHIVSSLIFFVITTVPASLLKINMYLMLAFVIILALPALAFTRALWVTSVQKVMKHG